MAGEPAAGDESQDEERGDVEKGYRSRVMLGIVARKKGARSDSPFPRIDVGARIV